eukprot:TRINITY_DN16088_c0_g1_i4.p1 TRINITY_DN16088_c0_g1~~TRINITY_DN16088_c0_g1_i4.p1  ORF type:complete len:1105 (+),score=181.12 TRINITY_DN16088_c0_g1_i4:151-3465(+)
MTNLLERPKEESLPIMSLLEELEEYKKLKQKQHEFKDSYVFSLITQKGYVLSKEWHRRWKRYVGGISRHISSSLKSWSGMHRGLIMKREHPGPIKNNDILDKEKFCKLGNSDDPCNTPLLSTARLHNDFKVITKKQWDFLFKLYSGVPIRKEMYIAPFTNKLVPDTNFLKVRLAIYVQPENSNSSEPVDIKSVFVSRRWDFAKVEKRIKNVLSKKPKTDKKKFRLWLLKSQDDLEAFSEVVKTQSGHDLSPTKSKEATIKKSREPSIGEHSNESLNALPGRESIKCQLEGKSAFLGMFIGEEHKNLFRSDLLKSTDIILVETADTSGKFTLSGGPLKSGKCSRCSKDILIRWPGTGKEEVCGAESCKNKDEEIEEMQDVREEEVKAMEDAMDLMFRSWKPGDPMYYRGRRGLVNKGFTCYMNSAIQCLSNTPLLTEYFHNGWYERDINETGNPRSKGKLPREYARLINDLWSNSENSLDPAYFKAAVNTFLKIFEDNRQHDSQELLLALLNGLHEDLNRVKVKSHIDSIQDTDSENYRAAEKYWHDRLKNNQSVIVDLMGGQSSSTMQCVECKHYIINYEYFVILTLEIPMKTRVDLYFVPFDLSKEIVKTSVVMIFDRKVKITVDDLKKEIASMFEVDKGKLMLARMKNMKFEKFLANNLELNETAETCLYVHEIASEYNDQSPRDATKERKVSDTENREEDKNFEEKDEDSINLSKGMIRVCLILCEKADNRSGSREKQVTESRLLYVDKNCTMKKLHIAIMLHLRPLFIPAIISARDMRQIPDLNLFTKLFSKITCKNWTTKISSNRYYPYKLKFVSNKDLNQECYYCSKSNCDDCFIPYTDDTLLKIMKLDDGKLINNYYDENCRTLEIKVVFSTHNAKKRIDLSSVKNLRIRVNESAAIVNNDVVTIDDCFKKFTTSEKLDKSNEWRCRNCERLTQGIKQTEIVRCPPIFIIQLKRFNFITETASKRVNTLVKFPIRGLDLKNYVKLDKENAVYDLYAINNHYSTLEDGHYTALTLNEGKWYQYNDIAVTAANEAELCTEAAYILFYKRRDLTEDTTLESLRQEVAEEVGESEARSESFKEDPEATISVGQEEDEVEEV